MTRKRSIIIGAAAGIVVAFATAILSEAVPRGTLARQLFEGIHWPEGAFLEWLVDRLSPHNRDQGVLYWLVVHPLYWAIIGALVGLGCSWFARFRRRHIGV